MQAVTNVATRVVGTDVTALPCSAQCLIALGVVTAAYVGFKALSWLHTTFLAQGVAVASQGKWAVVTGATDGIGKAYAFELARHGMNVALISRTQSKLDDVEAELKKAHPNVETMTVQADFSDGYGSGLYQRIGAAIASLDIGILVNNVGYSYPSALFFHELKQLAEEDLAQKLISINVESTTHMTALVLPGMLERKRGVVLNLSSANGHLPVGSPLYAGYSAAKAYVDFFTRSLSSELAGTGVTASCHLPYFVVSKMSKIRKASVGTPTPKTWVRSSLAKIGVGTSIVPYWSHRMQDAVVFAVPRSILAPLITKMHKGLRKRYLRSLERKNKKE